MICIIDYKLGNICSLAKAFKKIGSKVIVSHKIPDIEKAEKLVLPGVGSFEKGMKNLQDLDLVTPLRKQVLEDKKPLLGICLGMQLLFKNSEEGQLIPGLNFINGEIKKFNFDPKSKLKIPHIGWNDVFGENLSQMPLFQGIENHSNFYFVHSYHATLHEKNPCLYTNYGYDFISFIQKNNIFGTQFHPEKSQKRGLKILKNFISLEAKNA